MILRGFRFVLVLVLLEDWSAATAAETTVFSKTYVREAGRPAEWDDAVEIPANAAPPFVLRIQNGEQDGSARVSSAQLAVNGTPVLGPQDLDQQVFRLERTVELPGGTAQLALRLNSNPGGKLTLTLVGTALALGPEPPPELRLGHGEYMPGDPYHIFSGKPGRPVTLLHWSSSPSEGVVSYRIYRGTRSNDLQLLAEVPAGRDDPADRSHGDHDPPIDTVLFYAISAVDEAGLEGRPSAPEPISFQGRGAPKRFSKFDEKLSELYEIFNVVSSDRNLMMDLLGGFYYREDPYRVAVMVLVDQGPPVPQEYLETLEQAGAESAYTDGRLVFAYFPIEGFGRLQTLPFVSEVSVDHKEFVDQQSASAQQGVSESILKTIGADGLHKIDVKGQGVLVADMGQTGEHLDITTSAIKMVAPEATVLKFRGLENSRFKDALPFAVGHNPDIMNMSFILGPSVFTAHTLNQFVKDRPDILFFVSAGNFDNVHRTTTMQDVGGIPGAVDFGSDDLLSISNAHRKKVIFYAYSSQLGNYLDEPAGDSGKVELFLCTPLCKGKVLQRRREAMSDTDFRLDENGEPVESGGELIEWDDSFRFGVLMGPKIDTDEDGVADTYANLNRSLHIYVVAELEEGDEDIILEGASPDSSITGLSAVPGVLTIGATVQLEGREFVAPFSSRGAAHLPAVLPEARITLGFPTHGIPKPDLVAPGVFELPDGKQEHGTSISSPYAAGAAALLMQLYRGKNGGTGSEQETKFVKGGLTTRLRKPLRPGEPLPQLDYGYGRIDLRDARTWVTTGSRLYRITPEGVAEEVPYNPTSIITDLNAEVGGTDAVWFIDALADTVVRLQPDGKKAVYSPEVPSDFVYTLTYSSFEGAAWVAKDVEGPGWNSYLVRLEHVPGPNGGALVPTAEIQQQGLDFRAMAADPEREALWAIVGYLGGDQLRYTRFWVQSPDLDGLQSIPWNYAAGPRHLGIDPRDGSVWAVHGGTSLNFVHIAADGQDVMRKSLSVAPVSFRGFSVDPLTGDLWVSSFHNWTRYSSAAEPYQSILPKLGGPVSFSTGAKVSPLDGSVWAIDGVNFSNPLLRHWERERSPDPNAPDLHDPIPLVRGQGGEVSLWLGIPDLTDPHAVPPEPTPTPEPTPPPVSSAALAEPLTPWEQSTELALIAQEAEAEGLTVGEWARLDHERWERLAAAAQDYRRWAGWE